MSFAEANNYLAVHLHQELAKDKKNVFFSPFSISVAMGMLLCASEGKTASELRAALGHEHAGIKKDETVSVFERELSLLLKPSDSYTFSFANSMLSQIGFNVKEEYKKIISESFKALLLEVDFAGDNQNVLKHINEWVKEKTNNMIPEFLKTLNSGTILVLLNAVYFKGTWKQQFDKEETTSEKFYNNGVEKNAKKIKMMYMKESFPYYEDETRQILQLPYIGDEVAMMIILPRKRDGIESVETTLTPSFVQDLKAKFRKQKIKVTIPRFRMEYEKRLVRNFKELGVQQIFLPSADFTHLTDEKGIFVSIIFHKAVLEVNEEGSEAAAATIVAMGRSAPRPVPEFIADHPFVLVIYNTKNDLILFMGRVNEL